MAQQFCGQLNMRVMASLGLALLISACVNPSSKIASELSRYGLDQSRAQCVGDRLEANLSMSQLQQLGKAARAYGRDDANPGQLTMGDLVRAAGEINDPSVPIEVGKAAIGCNVLQSSAIGL